MKNIFIFFAFLPLITLAQVGVNTTTPNGMLDVQSTNNGVLISRVALTSITDAVTVVNPAGGALTTSTLVFNTATAGVSPNNVIPGFYYWNNATSRWIPIAASSGWELDGNTAITSPAVPATYGTSSIGATENFIGTTDNNDVTLGTNDIERMRIKNTSGNIGIGTANPTEKLHVFQSSNATKSGIFSEVQQIATGTDYDNIAIKGYGRGVPAWGLGNGIMGIGDVANSYYATGIYAHLGTTAPSLPLTNQALYVNGNGLGSAGIFMGGNVGINTQSPNLAKFQVDGMIGNTTALFRGNSSTSQGIAMVADWPGIYFNSYYNSGVRAMAASGYPSIINTDQSSGSISFQTTNVANTIAGGVVTVPERMRITGAGNVGIGVTNPSNLLHVNSASSGAVRIVDGTQGANKVLTSDVNGVGTWKPVGIDNIQANLSGVTGISISYTDTVNFLQTGASITLPPGRYAVNVTMLLSTVPGAYTNSNEAFWVRSTFSDSNGLNPAPSGHIVGSFLVSGNLVPSTLYSLISGMIVINNPGPGPNTYYYVAGRVVTNNSTRTIAFFGGNYWAENNIIAYRLN